MESPELWVGRSRELERLTDAIRRRRSLLVWGPPDSGKTALVERCIAMLPRARSTRCLRFHVNSCLQQLLQEHLIQLGEAGDPLIRGKFAGEASRSRSFETWVRKQKSIRLRGLLYRATRENSYWLFWDDSPILGHAHSRVLDELVSMNKTPVYLTAEGFKEKHIGEGWHHYWHDGLRLELGPLRMPEGEELLERCIEWHRLSRFDLTDFRQEILELSGLLPGAIRKMAELAGQPGYQYGDRIKTRLVSVEYLRRRAACYSSTAVQLAS